jgi:hypothetical protein
VTWGVLALATLASYRVARLVTTDTLAAPLRSALAHRFPPRVEPLRDDAGMPIEGTGHLVARWPVELVNCFWCMSVWSSLAALVVAHFCGLLASWQLLGLAWLASAAVAGLLYQLVEA